MMSTVIRSSYLNMKNYKYAALDRKEDWGFRFVYSDKNKLERNTVMMAAGLL